MLAQLLGLRNEIKGKTEHRSKVLIPLLTAEESTERSSSCLFPLSPTLSVVVLILILILINV